MEPGDILGHQAIGRGRGGRPGGRRARRAWRPGGDPIQHIMQALLDVLAAVVHPVRDHRGIERGARVLAVRLRRLVQPSPRGPGSRSCGSPRPTRSGPIPVPEGPPDDRFLYLSDILPTGWQAGPVRDVPARRDGGRVRARPGRANAGAQRPGHGRGPRVQRGPRARAAGRWPAVRGVEAIEARPRSTTCLPSCSTRAAAAARTASSTRSRMEAHSSPGREDRARDRLQAARRARREGGQVVRGRPSSRRCWTR